MSKIIIFLVLLVVAFSQADRDWSKIKTFGPGLEPRIVGGQEATPHSFPHQVALFISTNAGTFFCGGSLVSLTTVLTAAHCVDKANSVEVVLGAHNISQSEPTQKIYVSSNVKVHERWSSLLLINDIAVVRLDEQVQLDENIQLIALQGNGGSLTGEQAVLSGWGKTSDNSNGISDVLQYFEPKIISNLECSLRFPLSIRSTHICSSGAGWKNPCNGDSGGPLVVANKQCGIVSFGFTQCGWGWPAVYTRVTEFLDWIVANSDVVIS